MGKKKVAVIGVKGLPGFGGASRANNYILPQLSKEYDITVYAFNSHAEKKDYKGLKQHIFKKRFKSKKINSLILFLKSTFHALLIGNYDLIHFNHGVSGFFLLFLKFRFKIITTIRGLNFNEDDKWNSIEHNFLKLSEWCAFNFSDYITTVQKSSVPKIKQKTNKPVFYISNGVEDYYKSLRNVEKEKVITFSAARIIYLKGGHDFLRALQRINFTHKIRIIGDLNHVPKYKEKILNLSEGLDVELTGLIKDQNKLFSLIASSRLYVFPSYSEGMSNMLLEVASLKVPIIASDITPNKDVFNDQELIYFSVGNVKELSEKIEYYWDHPEESKEFSSNAHKKVISEYQWEKIAKEYGKLYSTILQK